MAQRSGILSDHQRIGKKFYPSGARIFWKEIHYIERLLPEIAWIGYFSKELGLVTGFECALDFITTCHESKLPHNCELTLCSNYRQLETADWHVVRKRLKGRDMYLAVLDSLGSFLRCFPEANPLLGLFEEVAVRDPSKKDVERTRQVVREIFDRRSRIASVVQAVVFRAGMLLGTHHVPEDFPYADVDVLLRDEQSEKAQSAAAHVRMHVNGIYQWWESRIGDEWARYFWNRGRDFSPLGARNHEELPEADEKAHPAIRLGTDFEKYAWGVVDAVWKQLPVDIFECELFEVLGALLARQCVLAAKLFNNVELWDYHAGPLFLRPMTDCIITAAWILKDPRDRARKFISYGLGQEKLMIERLKVAAEKEPPEARSQFEESIRFRERWLNGQHYAFLQSVDVGSWSGISTRKMAEEADRLGLYDFAYTGWSHAAHGTWNHIGQFDVWPSSEPLHKHIMQPANFQHGYHVDVLENAAKYFDELAVLLVQHFKLETSVPQPLDWVTARLAQFYREMDILQADREGSPPAKDQSPET